jgi:hypothetical protein
MKTRGKAMVTFSASIPQVGFSEPSILAALILPHQFIRKSNSASAFRPRRRKR